MISLKEYQVLIKQASVTGNTVKQSVSGGENNPILLQEEEQNVAEETNDDTAVNTEANEINDKNKHMAVTIEEENKTLEYQETMNLDIGNLPVQINHFGYQYMKLLMIHILK